MWIYYWERYGYLRAQHLFANDYLKDKGHILKGNPNLVNVLGGKLDFLKMVKGQHDSTYASLKNRYEHLRGNEIKEKGNSLDNVLNLFKSKGLNFAMNEYRKLKNNG
jgi:hypothetical protein